MPTQADRAIDCPRCKYDLRGAAEPRCPECGFPFTWPEFETGVLRDNQPTRLDQADPWQPHQVLIRSLYELLRGVLHPRRLLKTVDVNGSLAPAIMMFVCGLFWNWLLLTILTTIAILTHDIASPATAIKTGALVFAPRMLLVAGIVTTMFTPLIGYARVTRLARITPRALLRLTGYFIPVNSLYTCVAYAIVLLAVPDFALRDRGAWAIVPLITGVVLISPPCPRHAGRSALILFCILIVVLFAARYLVGHILPATLEPPWWIYF